VIIRAPELNGFAGLGERMSARASEGKAAIGALGIEAVVTVSVVRCGQLLVMEAGCSTGGGAARRVAP